MNYPKYDLVASTDRAVFEFMSNGARGSIPKLIQFEATSSPGYYNLAFGDKTCRIMDGVEVEYMDDQSNSGNGDRDRVLATVAAATYEYTSIYPDRTVIFSGSTPARTRLYRMAISYNYPELSVDFEISGIFVADTGNTIVPFESNKVFIAYLVKRKATVI
jgi:hypothetical protein